MSTDCDRPLPSSVSVLMPCRNAGPFLIPAVRSVLTQPECLELLVADGGSTDGTLQVLDEMAAYDSRVRLVSRADDGPADALNKAFRVARGTFIGWLNSDDLYAPGALERAVAALNAHHDWLMVYGEGEEFNEDTGLVRRYPTLPASVGLQGFLSHCFICQPSVVFRRSMGVLLGEFDPQWRTAFDFDYWLRAFSSFPHRIGYLPHLQGRTRLHGETITYRQRAQVALEATQLEARHFGMAEATCLNNYALELQLGLAPKPDDVNLASHLRQLFESARLALSADAFAYLESKWLTADSPPPPPTDLCSWKPESFAHAVPQVIVPFAERPFGVNLIGHAFETFGVAEDIRMAASALQAVNIPCCVIDHPASNGSSRSDRSLENLICSDPAGGPYAFNFVCMTAPMQARWLRLHGCDPLLERYTISSWPWETQEWPVAWNPLLDVVDELWPSSNFTASAFSGPASLRDLPIQVMPMAAEISEPQRFCHPRERFKTRERYGLRTSSVLFGYGFDLNSTAIRKNPLGALEVFQRAFPLPNLAATFGCDSRWHPLSDQVALMIKAFPPRGFSAEWELLQARVEEDPRIVLIAESLPRDALFSLYGACDVFLSLHRSEGFGRGLAEALQLGADVVATNFGGNTDFCTGRLAHPVRWRKAPIPRGSYPHADGHSWAEPNLEHAVQLCRQVAADRSTQDSDELLLTEYRNKFSFAAVGERYRQRLQFLWKNRIETSARLRWRNDSCPLPR